MKSSGTAAFPARTGLSGGYAGGRSQWPPPPSARARPADAARLGGVITSGGLVSFGGVPALPRIVAPGRPSPSTLPMLLWGRAG
jgi:hypothetical protein